MVASIKPFLLLVLLALIANGAKTTKAPTRKPLQCDDMDSLYCPNTKPIPQVVFPAQGGTMTNAVSAACCPTKYAQCQEQEKKPLCRVLGQYTITGATGNMEEACKYQFDLQENCRCQDIAKDREKTLQFNFCPKTTDCCPECECHGDPHCSPFNQDTPSAVWAVCDDRGPNCLHTPETCVVTNYTGVPCVWSHQTSSCVHAAGTPQPRMTMYTKQYKDYFNTQDTKTYDFGLYLELTTYGSIGVIRIMDAGVNITFSIAPNGNCVAPNKYPLNNQKQSLVKGLKSGVEMLVTCSANGANQPHRWDIVYVRDPWYVADGANFGGYCKTGVISEKHDNAIGGCNHHDRNIAQFYGCPVTTPMDQCKVQFCNQNAGGMTFPGTGSNVNKCIAYLNGNGTDPANYLKSSCALATLTAPQNPEKCKTTKVCSQCMDNINDYPEQIPEILGAPVATHAPTVPQTCPPKGLVAAGLQRKKLPTAASGVQIEFQTSNTTWVSVFALLDSEIAACGGCKYVMTANVNMFPEHAPLFWPGKYRIRQCAGYDAGRPLSKSELCSSPVGYNSTVTYFDPSAQGAGLSETYRDLYDHNKLVCSTDLYPTSVCPKNYKCCQWDKAKKYLSWKDCMTQHGWDEAVYPHCG